MKLAISAAVVTISLFALAACGGDDSGPRETLGNITPIGTKQTTPEPSTSGGSDGGSEAPSPVAPQIDSELTLFLDGLLQADILPGDSYTVDPVALAQQVGTPPSCDFFQFDFSWQVTDPYPPDGVAFSWQLDHDGGPVEIANGPAGNQTIGCGVLHATNAGAAPITVAVHYLIGGK